MIGIPESVSNCITEHILPMHLAGRLQVGKDRQMKLHRKRITVMLYYAYSS